MQQSWRVVKFSISKTSRSTVCPHGPRWRSEERKLKVAKDYNMDGTKKLLREQSLAARLYGAKSAIEDMLLHVLPAGLVCYPPSETNPEGGPLVRDVIESHILCFLEDLEPMLLEMEAIAGQQKAAAERLADMLSHHFPKKGS